MKVIWERNQDWNFSLDTIVVYRLDFDFVNCKWPSPKSSNVINCGAVQKSVLIFEVFVVTYP